MDRLGGSPRQPWLAIFVFAVALWFASVGALEAYWRGRGYETNVADSKDLWHFWRQRVYCSNGKVVVFIGTSRVMSDISLGTAAAFLPDYRVVQLGLMGSESSIGLLKELADDSRFSGLIVCELDTPLLDRFLWQDHQDVLQYCPSSTSRYMDAIATAFLADRFVILQPVVTLNRSIRRYLSGGQAPRPVVRLTFHRQADWRAGSAQEAERVRSRTNSECRVTYESRQFTHFASLGPSIRAINAMVETIRARGGDVIFLRAPSSRERWQLEEHYHSRSDNWDRFEQLSLARCLHFKDDKATDQLQCFDDSHLDPQQAADFTRRLLKRFAGVGFLEVAGLPAH